MEEATSASTESNLAPLTIDLLLEVVNKIKPPKWEGIRCGEKYFEYLKTLPNKKVKNIGELTGIRVYLDETLKPDEFKMIPFGTNYKKETL